MKLMRVFLLLGGAGLSSCVLPDKALGEEQKMFLAKYKSEIQEYAMTGYEKGWKQCDILSANTFLDEGEPQISMDLDKIKTMNIKSAFSSSHCLLVIYPIASNHELEGILDFGRNASLHVRLALVVKMASGISLDMAVNTTKLPFLVAAELDNQKEQFLCPVVGKNIPSLQGYMCEPSHADYLFKELRIGVLGVPPYIFPLNNDYTSSSFDGVDMRMIMILAKRLKFIPKFTVSPTFEVTLVRSIYLQFIWIAQFLLSVYQKRS